MSKVERSSLEPLSLSENERSTSERLDSLTEVDIMKEKSDELLALALTGSMPDVVVIAVMGTGAVIVLLCDCCMDDDWLGALSGHRDNK